VLFDIVTGNVLPDAAAVTIEQHASAMPACDQLRFLELVEKELEALHEGNIARYWIRPAEFMVWKASWESGRSTGIIGSRVVGMEQLITPAN
jgi:hypothetical protein